MAFTFQRGGRVLESRRHIFATFAGAEEWVGYGGIRPRYSVRLFPQIGPRRTIRIYTQAHSKPEKLRLCPNSCLIPDCFSEHLRVNRYHADVDKLVLTFIMHLA